MANSNQNRVLKEKGRHLEEEAFVLIKNGLYLGYGFVQISEQILHSDHLETFLIPQKETMEVQGILRKMLLQSSNLQTLDFI